MNPLFEKIAQYIQNHVQADDYSLSIRSNDSHETRFAQNGITQHIAGPGLEIDLEVAFGQKTGGGSVNQSDEDTLGQLIKTAQDIARLNRPDPEYLPSVGAQELPRVNNLDPATRDLEPAKMVEIVAQAIAKAKAYGATVSGMTEKHLVESALFTKNGFAGYDASTEFGHSMTLKKDAVETKVSYSALDFGSFSLDKEFERLLSQAESLQKMKDFDPCKIAVILRPPALEELLWFMAWMMNRRQSDEGFTPYTGQLGQPFFGEKFSLRSTLKEPRLHARPFDREGIANREISWVENGVLKNLPTNRHWAKEKNAQPQSMYNFFIPGGAASEEEMMKLVPRGLIINRFWYIRTVDAKAGEFTGMTRDGVLYFEDGQVKNAVNNLRFNEMPHDATRRILALGKQESPSPSSYIPTMLIEAFNFVDKTTF
ncbi:MAG: metallopeptidase TldD-related protein [Candidatus Cloacimonetes bacterium]|nr:metallopeptidase TldD-related protein [Candidatus Cloacimonadota bacterium]